MARVKTELRSSGSGRGSIVIATALLCVLAPVGALAQADWETIAQGHEIAVKREYYQIRGETAEALLREMQRKGPSGDTPDDRFYAITRSQSSFRYETLRRGSTCTLTSVGVRTDIVVLLPKWEGENGSDPLAKQWREFIRKLEQHENGHVSISRSGSEKMYLSLKGLPSASCGALKETARSTAKRLSDKVQEENEQYDQMTGHGRSQGAVWRVTTGGPRDPRSAG